MDDIDWTNKNSISMYLNPCMTGEWVLDITQNVQGTNVPMHQQRRNGQDLGVEFCYSLRWIGIQ